MIRSLCALAAIVLLAGCARSPLSIVDGPWEPDLGADTRPSPDHHYADLSDVPPSPGCTVDHDLRAGNGVRYFNTVTDILPLCDGWVYLTEREAKLVVLANLVLGQQRTTYRLTGRPERLALDPEAELLYSTMSDQPDLARIDLRTGELKYIPLGEPARAVGLLDDGFVFAYLVGVERYAIVDRAGKVRATIDVPPEDRLHGQPAVAWSPSLKRLYLGTETRDLGHAATPTTLEAATVDLQAMTVKVVQKVGVVGNGRDVRVSADGKHLLNVMNEHGSMPDWDPKDLAAPPRDWSAISDPFGFDFSADGSLALIADSKIVGASYQLAVYRTADRKRVMGPVKVFLCQRRPRFSRGGRLAYSFDMPPLTDWAGAAVTWWALP